MVQVAFFVGAIGALGGAIAVIGLRNPFYSVLALVVHLVSLAGLFLLLHAEFVAAAQIVVYAGAVMVLYVFVAAYVGNVDEPLWEPIPGQRILAPLLGLALFVELSIAILGTGLKTLDSEGPIIEAGFGSPAAIGQLLLEDFLIAFEVASLLLLLVAVGAVVLAGRRPEPGAPPPEGSARRIADDPARTDPDAPTTTPGGEGLDESLARERTAGGRSGGQPSAESAVADRRRTSSGPGPTGPREGSG
jgi:NADH-quinone oxidoreductase subunit J